MPSTMVDQSVIIVSDCEDSIQGESTSLVDGDNSIFITYSKEADVLPHARSDCALHVFCPEENECSCALSDNSVFCEQCYCYICDGLASQCKHWTTPGICHCNAHNKSIFWKGQRSLATNGSLAMFNLSTELIDDDIKNAGKLLDTFIMNLKMLYNHYLMGVEFQGEACACMCHVAGIISFCKACVVQHFMLKEYLYQPVYSAVETFLSDLDALGPSGQMVALLGVIQEIMQHKEIPSSCRQRGSFWKNVLKPAVASLMEIIQLKAHLIQVEHNLPSALLNELKIFYNSLFFPTHCSRYCNSMFIIPWDEPILLAVCRGQNISGIFYIKGKRQYLNENFDVVMARKNKLLQEEKYQELIRYLKVVRTNNMPGLVELHYEIPLYLCKLERHFDALRWMTQSTGSAINLSSAVIKTIIIDASKLIHDTVAPASRKKPSLFLALALRIIFLNENLRRDIASFGMLVQLLCTSPTPGGTDHARSQALNRPRQQLFETSHSVVEGISKFGLERVPYIPNAYSSKAGCVIIATGFIIHTFSLEIIMPEDIWHLLLSYGSNMWAVEFLLYSIQNFVPFTFIGGMKNYACNEGIIERLAVQNLEESCALTDEFMKVDRVEFKDLGIFFARLIFFIIMRNFTITSEKKEFVTEWMVSKVIPLLVRFNTEESLSLQMDLLL